jgi:hypothetical protein
MQFSFLVEYCNISRIRTKTSIPSAALTFLASLFVCITSVLEHIKSPAPSFPLSIYLLTSLLLDTVRIRTLWEIGEATALASTFAAGFAAKLLLLVLESWNKRNYLVKEDRELSGEELAGFLSKSLFLWLNPLLMKGFRHWLTPPDLSPIDSALSSARLAKLFTDVTYAQYGKLFWCLERAS